LNDLPTVELFPRCFYNCCFLFTYHSCF